jgi:hypothetical protein
MSPSLRLRASPDVVSREVGDEAVILHLEDGLYYGLNPVGARVWALLDGSRSLAAVADQLHAEFDAPVDRVLGDVLALAADLFRHHLVTAIG